MHAGGAPVTVVFAAMQRELRPLARILGLRPVALCGLPAWQRERLVAVALGVGPARAHAGATGVLAELNVSRVLVTGVAGAVDAALEVGDLVRPESVVDVRTGRVLVPSDGGAGVVRSGLLATIDQIWTGAEPPGATGPLLPPGTTAVDMESAAVAALAEDMALQWDVVRAISDVAGTLTPELTTLLRPDGSVDVRGAIRIVLSDPRLAVRLVRVGLGTARGVRVATRAVIAALGADAPLGEARG